MSLTIDSFERNILYSLCGMICISTCTYNVDEVWSLKGWQCRRIGQIVPLFFSSVHFKLCNHINNIIYGIAVISDFAKGRKIEKWKFDFFSPGQSDCPWGPLGFQSSGCMGYFPIVKCLNMPLATEVCLVLSLKTCWFILPAAVIYSDLFLN